jgi:hypothetical protein
LKGLAVPTLRDILYLIKLAYLVPVLAAGVKPLIGTALMDGYHLSIYFQIDGAVNLAAIA